MNLQIQAEVNVEGLAEDILAKLEGAVPQIEGAMAESYHQIVLGNFGDSGVARPWGWAPLSAAYAKRVGREHATLVVSGHLMSSVRLDTAKAEVSVNKDDCVYALAHQFGYPPHHLPARPFFPIDENGDSTQYAKDAVVHAAEAMCLEVLK